MRKSEEYLFDTVRSVGISLMVSALIGMLLRVDHTQPLRLIMVFLLGIIENIAGYLALRARERKGASHERS